MTKFKIPEIRMPTLEEHRATSARWLKRVGPCLYENWPQTIKDLSFRTELVELMQEDQETLWKMFDKDRDDQALAALSEKLTVSLQAFDTEGCFVRLSSRSPKDFYYPDIPRIRTGKEVTDALLSSMRILDDLTEYKYADTKCYLLLREYHTIPKHEEWRCFILDRKVVGITQYHYHEFFPQLVEERELILGRIQQFLEHQVLPILHVDTVVVDVWLRGEPLLIEINPYGLSDPCLLSYPELEESEPPLFRIVENAIPHEA